ncbi:MAG: hypothetical protein O9288_17335 [Novosphingobium sp.]|uniref:hypothetical protein n=1 Tax=Novosphingobium sp. TaxID=1874826 RepID=UPI0022C0E0EE|nr:hypothetical protein [Novosphingobium sp.]MCZ8036495.1 hypothetical protein [Novosphingobium sp.]
MAQVLTLPVALISAATSGYFSYRAIEIAGAALAMESKYKAVSMKPRLFGRTELGEGKIAITNTGSGAAAIVSVAIEFRGKCSISSDKLNWSVEFDAIMNSIADGYALRLKENKIIDDSYQSFASSSTAGSQRDLVSNGEWTLLSMKPITLNSRAQLEIATHAWSNVIRDLNFSMIYRSIVDDENFEFKSSDDTSALWDCISARRRSAVSR